MPFHDVYLVELQQDTGNMATAQRVQQGTEQPWILEVDAALERVKKEGGEAVLVGIW
jgi:predicted enzyme related to lactoylglutathione lyase